MEVRLESELPELYFEAFLIAQEMVVDEIAKLSWKLKKWGNLRYVGLYGFRTGGRHSSHYDS